MQVLDNFTSSMTKPLDGRQIWESLVELEANTATKMPEGFQAFCKAEKKWYQMSLDVGGDANDPTSYLWTEVQGASIVIDSVISDVSTNPVQNRVIYNTLLNKQDKLIAGINLDDIVTPDSDNPITSGAVDDAIKAIQGQYNFVGLFESYVAMQAYATPMDNDWCDVVDETHEGQISKYIYNGALGEWVYDGEVSQANIQVDDDDISESKVWSSEKTNEEIQSLYKNYEVGVPYIVGEYFVHNHAVFKVTTDIPIENNISFDDIKGSVTLHIGNGDIVSCYYDDTTSTLFMGALITDSVTYNSLNSTLNIFPTI